MKRLLLWNFLLAVCATAGIYELRKEWIETRAQEQIVLLRRPAAPKVDAPPVPLKLATFQAMSYNDVAQKTLFAKDRNPNIEIVAPPLPPPAPPMPNLPKVYGVLGLPSGSVAIMSEKSGGPQAKVRTGEHMGEFTVAKLDSQKITLQWNDKTVEKSIDELLDRASVPAAAPDPAHGAPIAAAALPPSGPPSPPEFGIEIGAAGHSVRACKDQSVETSPEGTIIGGYKKHFEDTPFTKACRWLPVN